MAKVYANQYCFTQTSAVYILTDVEEVKKYAMVIISRSAWSIPCV